MILLTKRSVLYFVAAGFFLGVVASHTILQDKTAVAAKVVTIHSRNLEYQVETFAPSVGELLREQNIPELEAVNPNMDEPIVYGMSIAVQTPLDIVVNDGGDIKSYKTTAASVLDFIASEKIALATTDRVSPDFDTFLSDGMVLQIDRIVDLEINETTEIPFQVKLEYDPNSYYGNEAVVTAGANGSKIEHFIITYENGVEIKRRKLGEEIVRTQTDELRTFGTKIEVVENVTGRASWYAYRGCMCAAHPYYAKGSYVRVTAEAGGKSIIVRINDRGPDVTIHPDRVIDLDSVAFKQLAPLGAGTIAVRTELLRH